MPFGTLPIAIPLLMKNNLIYEYISSIFPIILGEGKRLFIGGIPSFELNASPSVYYDSGITQVKFTKV